jgi:glycopeptide antibiotics resistance protein
LLLDAAILAAVYFVFLYRRWKREEKFGLKSLRYLYICAVLAVTLMPFALSIFKGNNKYLQMANLIPFIDIIKHHNGTVREMLLNIFMLVPYGFLTPMIKRAMCSCGHYRSESFYPAQR